MTLNYCCCLSSNTRNTNLKACTFCRGNTFYCLKLKFVSPLLIMENVWIGGITSAIDEGELKRLNISNVVILSSECCLEFFNDFKYSRVEIGIDKVKLEDLDTVADLVNKAKSGVLVHDIGNGNRSALGVIAYLIKHKQYSLKNALEVINRKKGIIYMPKDYLILLQLFADKYYKESKRELMSLKENEEVSLK